jgi:hypothetical protein
VHDLVALEGQGVVTAYVASSEFVEGGAARARALGYAAVPAVHVAHPIQDRSDDDRVSWPSAPWRRCGRLTTALSAT